MLIMGPTTAVPRQLDLCALLRKKSFFLFDTSGLAALAEEGVFKEFYLVSQDPAHRRQKVGAAMVEFIPYETFLRRLHDGAIG